MRLRSGRRSVRGAFKVIGLGESRQRAARRLGVPMQLSHESIRTGETHRVSQSFDERDVHAVTVEIAVDVEHMYLEGSALFAEGRTSAEIHHTAEATA